jgi:hypothetical protein
VSIRLADGGALDIGGDGADISVAVVVVKWILGAGALVIGHA